MALIILRDIFPYCDQFTVLCFHIFKLSFNYLLDCSKTDGVLIRDVNV